MQIVINISEEDFERCKKKFQMRIDIMGDAIANGTPLSKGHGRLIDADKLYEEEKRDWLCVNNASFISTDYAHVFAEIDNAPTIIKADEVVK